MPWNATWSMSWFTAKAATWLTISLVVKSRLKPKRPLEQWPHVRRHPICEDTQTVLRKPPPMGVCANTVSVRAPSSQRKTTFISSHLPSRNFNTLGKRCNIAVYSRAA